jgi:hypothetical protein
VPSVATASAIAVAAGEHRQHRPDRFALMSLRAARGIQHLEKPFVESLHLQIFGAARDRLAEVVGRGHDVGALPDVMACAEEGPVAHVSKCALSLKSSSC